MIAEFDPRQGLRVVTDGAYGPIDVSEAGIAFVDGRQSSALRPTVLGQAGIRRIASVNDPLRQRLRSAITEIVYRCAHPDGRSIHALVAYGAERADLSDRPVVVSLHGGPYTASTVEYDPVREFLVARGFVVIEPNYRGSAGYGTDFLQLSDRTHYPGWADDPTQPHEMASTS
ncbi:MAG: peptidase [Microbacterium sp.]|uniref:alpha/beta hydrolase family protein n=1 Tax=Microbacterium sp. TaxID=51671 RepID=UPI00262D78AE|nr:hypothetical protein [Microbacterium sp.]MDF2563161.1 peptidase [Microbacterium sp.]